MLRYQNNAFRVLGITPNVSMKDVMQRVNEIKVKESLGMQVTYDYDFIWLGPIDRSAHNAINALQRLENPITRLKEEMTWFWFDTDKDRLAIECLIKNNKQGAYKIWEEITSFANPDNSSVSALFNQLILAHSSVIGKESLLKYGEIAEKVIELGKCPKCNLRFKKDYTFCIQCGFKLTKENQIVQEKTKNIELTEDHWKDWRFVLSRFMILNSSDIFWNKIVEKVQNSGDPRLMSLKIDELRDNFTKNMINVNLTFINNALFTKDYKRAKLHSQLLDEASFQPEALREGFNTVLSSRVGLLNRICKDTSEKVEQISEKDPVENILNIYECFKKEVVDIVNECNIVDINLISDLVLAKDNIAQVLKNISFKIHSIFNECDKAYAILEEAITYTVSSYLKNSFQKYREVLKSKLQEEQSLQYQDKIGNSVLDISKNKIIFGNKSLNCNDIKGIRAGIFIQRTNGIVSHRSYAIWLTDKGKTIEIECARGLFVGTKKVEQRFNDILQRLFKFVQLPLVLKMISNFESKQPVKVGDITIDHQGWYRDFSYDPISKGIVSIVSKIFGTEGVQDKETKKQFMLWNEYKGYYHEQGKVVMVKKSEKYKNGEIWASLNLREVWNAINLSIFLDWLSKDSRLWKIIN